MDLDKLLADYKGAYLSYPQVRRDVEFKLMAALVDEVKALKALANPPVMVSANDLEIAEALADTRPGAIVWVDPAAELPLKRKPGRPPKAEAA